MVRSSIVSMKSSAHVRRMQSVNQAEVPQLVKESSMVEAIPRLSREGSSVVDRFSSFLRAGGPQRLHVTYDGHGGFGRVIDVHMPEDKALAWAASLDTLLKKAPRVASPAHWRWAISCVAATGRRGATGSLKHAELQTLLRCANSSTDIHSQLAQHALVAAEESEQHAGLLDWLRSAATHGNRHRLLGLREIAGLLLRLCAMSNRMTEEFNRYAIAGRLNLTGWLSFIRTEQLTQTSEYGSCSTVRASSRVR
eukprot:4485796-Prymnesium_polylepis.1